jgi:hypothetical protein
LHAFRRGRTPIAPNEIFDASAIACEHGFMLAVATYIDRDAENDKEEKERKAKQNKPEPTQK